MSTTRATNTDRSSITLAIVAAALIAIAMYTGYQMGNEDQAKKPQLTGSHLAPGTALFIQNLGPDSIWADDTRINRDTIGTTATTWIYRPRPDTSGWVKIVLITRHK